MARTSVFCHRLLQVMHYLLALEVTASSALRHPQAASDTRATLEFHLHGFHRAVAGVFAIHCNPCGSLSLNQAEHIHSYIRHDHFRRPSPPFRLAYILEARCPKPCDIGPRIGVCLALLPIPRQGSRHEIAFHLGLSSRRRRSNRTCKPNSRTIPPSVLQLSTGQLVRVATTCQVCV